MIVLTPLRKFQFPVMAECINPDVFQGKTLDEIAALTVWEGNKQKTLRDLFTIEENRAETPIITISGDEAKAGIGGTSLRRGSFPRGGTAGIRLGEKMAG